MSTSQDGNESIAPAAFISYASEDKERAFEILASLEKSGHKCWIAPRNVRPGQEYGAEIMRGIEVSRCLVLVLSEAANRSQFVRREVERAVSKGKPVFPIRIEEVLPAPELELFVSTSQWIDAWSGNFVDHINRLAVELQNPEKFVATRQYKETTPKNRSKMALLAGGILLSILAAFALFGDHIPLFQTQLEKDDFPIEYSAKPEWNSIGWSFSIGVNSDLHNEISHALIDFQLGERPKQTNQFFSFFSDQTQILDPKLKLWIKGLKGRDYGPFEYQLNALPSLRKIADDYLASTPNWIRCGNGPRKWQQYGFELAYDCTVKIPKQLKWVVSSIDLANSENSYDWSVDSRNEGNGEISLTGSTFIIPITKEGVLSRIKFTDGTEFGPYQVHKSDGTRTATIAKSEKPDAPKLHITLAHPGEVFDQWRMSLLKPQNVSSVHWSFEEGPGRPMKDLDGAYYIDIRAKDIDLSVPHTNEIQPLPIHLTFKTPNGNDKKHSYLVDFWSMSRYHLIRKFVTEYIHRIECAARGAQSQYVKAASTTSCKIDNLRDEVVIPLSIKALRFGHTQKNLEVMPLSDLNTILQQSARIKWLDLSQQMADAQLELGQSRPETDQSESQSPIERWRNLQANNSIRSKIKQLEQKLRKIEGDISYTNHAIRTGVFFVSHDEFDEIFMQFIFWNGTETEVFKFPVKK